MSNVYNPSPSTFHALTNKVIVISGGANGIGAATVRHLASSGARVVFGDSDSAAGTALTQSINSPTRVLFVPVDVTNYADHLTLFRTALERFGRVDHAVAVAGVGERGDWFGTGLGVKDVEQLPTDATVRVNLLGVMYFVRVGLAYLREGRSEGEDRSVVMIGSAAGFRESPGLPVYQATKHAVQGLMRSLRKPLLEREGIRINVVCPGMTESAMTDGIVQHYRREGLAVNVPDDLAVTTLGLLVDGSMAGKAIYVEGGQGWEFEDGLKDTMPQWLGEGPTERLWEALRFVDKGDAWSFMQGQQTGT
ncbi:putative 3-hydroxyacyl-CoA dehydrogenase [Trichodelitschia bisporula]|uniref:Putative 3-hydroxyacyl-CoA dehydrogenase n=1 Tax=Trichodelitschia bisporula TaxID=703511 RepID=A0A6G1HVS2_9PEZI|nr:putative 3-hydroxyacyl-CoA dehydrogenase [Trichodelitschia bisporula]